MNKLDINKRVIVTSLGFRKNLAAYPKRIEFQGKTYNFIDAGLRCLVRQGERIAEILTLSDGTADFRLRHNNDDNTWTLLSMV
jgi:hypothetical protein